MRIQKLFTLLLISLVCYSVNSQTPQAFRYQTVIRDANGGILVNKIISIRVSILAASEDGQTIYSEKHNISTNDYGIVNLTIGKGTNLSGNLSEIKWGVNTYFLKIDLDISGNDNFQYMGTSQLMSVPYALYAERANISNADTSSTNELQTITRNANNITLSKNGGTVSIADNDNDTTNEIQTISKVGDSIMLSKNGGKIKDSDNQTLTINGNKLNISNGNFVTFSNIVDLDTDPTNEIQTLTYSNDTLKISQANQIVLPHDADRDSTNELQLISIKSDTLYLSKGNFVKLPFVRMRDLNLICNPDNEGEIRYDKLIHKLQFCNGSKWIDLNRKLQMLAVMGFLMAKLS
jgi:hypothetical protein